MLEIRNGQFFVGGHCYPLRNVTSVHTFVMPAPRWFAMVRVIVIAFSGCVLLDGLISSSAIGIGFGLLLAGVGVAMSIRPKVFPRWYAIHIEMTSGQGHLIAYPTESQTAALRDRLCEAIALASVTKTVNVDARAIHVHRNGERESFGWSRRSP